MYPCSTEIRPGCLRNISQSPAVSLTWEINDVVIRYVITCPQIKQHIQTFIWISFNPERLFWVETCRTVGGKGVVINVTGKVSSSGAGDLRPSVFSRTSCWIHPLSHTCSESQRTSAAWCQEWQVQISSTQSCSRVCWIWCAHSWLVFCIQLTAGLKCSELGMRRPTGSTSMVMRFQ